jgi:hypothetical protein
MKTDEELAAEIHKVCRGNHAAFARRHGFSRVYINMVSNGRRKMTERIAGLLGYEKRWVKKSDITKYN